MLLDWQATWTANSLPGWNQGNNAVHACFSSCYRDLDLLTPCLPLTKAAELEHVIWPLPCRPAQGHYCYTCELQPMPKPFLLLCHLLLLLLQPTCLQHLCLPAQALPGKASPVMQRQAASQLSTSLLTHSSAGLHPASWHLTSSVRSQLWWSSKYPAQTLQLIWQPWTCQEATCWRC
jgi:hypothetical protein